MLRHWRTGVGGPGQGSEFLKKHWKELARYPRIAARITVLKAKLAKQTKRSNLLVKASPVHRSWCKTWSSITPPRWAGSEEEEED
ncbi:hypothetical protein BDN67DRAFT_973818 [Paxillus ammoniavirescens]|nr:hypothetical protein BDN67DRAFT_973818 [Paxillus ammoniavirescens]